MFILQTTDRISNNYYFTKFFGTQEEISEICDPAKQFKSIKLEDGTKSVVTDVYKEFGTKMSLTEVFNLLDNTIDVSKIVPEPEKVYVKREPIAPPVELDEDIVEPETFVAPKAKSTKRNKPKAEVEVAQATDEPSEESVEE